MVYVVLRRVASLLLALFVLPVILPFPGLALGPLQNDAGSGGDAGDDHSNATPIGQGEYEGHLALPLDRTDIYGVKVARGDAIHVALEATGDFPVMLYLRVRLAEPTLDDDGLTTYGFVRSGENRTVYAPYDGTWYVEIAAPDIFWLHLHGAADYSFILGVDPGVATVHVFDSPAAAVELEGFEGTYQYHIDARLPSGTPGVVSTRTDGAFLHAGGWSSSVFASDILRTTWGDTLVSEPIPSFPETVDEVVAVSPMDVSVLGTVTSDPAVRHRTRLMSSGEPVRITFAYPTGTVAAVVAVEETLLRSVEDLDGGGLRTPVYQDLRGASASVPLDERFTGSFEDWGLKFYVVTPDGTERQSLPDRPAAGDWTIRSKGASYTPDADLPLLWGASYPDLGLYPDASPYFIIRHTWAWRGVSPV